MLRASHAVGRFVGLCFLRGFLRFARGLNVNDRQLAVNGFATALLWELSLMLRASHAVGRFVVLFAS